MGASFSHYGFLYLRKQDVWYYYYSQLSSLPCEIGDRSKNLSEGSITTLKISTGETVDQLRIMIRERWPHLFEKVPPASILLWKINDTEGVTSFEKQIEVYSSGKRLNETGMPPHDLISKHFSEQPPNDKIHIYIFI